MSISREESKILKAIAIMSVIFAHGYGWAGAFACVPIINSRRLLTFFVQCGLTLFLFLSGYGVYHSYSEKGFGAYWNNKIDKVFVPATIIQLVWCLVLFLCNSKSLVLGEGEWYELFLDIICVNPHNRADGTMWFLSFLLFCYLSFYFFFRFIHNKKAALMLLIVYWMILSPIMPRIWVDVQYYIPAFVMGIIVAFVSKIRIFHLRKRSLFYIILLLAVVISLYLVFLFRKNYVVDVVGGLCSAFLFILLVKLIGTGYLRHIGYFGGISFYIYLLEYKVMFGAVDYTRYSDAGRLLLFTVLFAITIILSFVVDAIMRRNA
ncbi:MAG: acyltransferase [Butyrivibrio sp.]|nr:acyltransferase [Butyrivibrio sp.]